MDLSNTFSDFVGITATPCGADDTDQAVFSITNPFPLRDSTLLDNCAATHVANNRNLLFDLRPAHADDYLLVGDSTLKVEARGKRVIKDIANGPKGPKTKDFTLVNVAFVPGFHTNIIALPLLKKKGFWYACNDETLRYGAEGNHVVFMNLKRMYNLTVAEYKSVDRSYFYLPRANTFVLAAMQSSKGQPRRQRRTNRDPKPPRCDTAELWHLRAGHLGPEALEHLVENARNVKIKGIPRSKCTACGVATAHHVVSRRPSDNRSTTPYYRVCLDLFEHDVAYNGHKYALVLTDEYSGSVHTLPPWLESRTPSTQSWILKPASSGILDSPSACFASKMKGL